MIRSRMLREAQARRERDQQLVEFVELLVTALDIPEVRAAVAAAIPSPAASPSGRGRQR